MATRGLGAKLGWDEGEAKEFSKALKQSLMVQTPLQVCYASGCRCIALACCGAFVSGHGAR